MEYRIFVNCLSDEFIQVRDDNGNFLGVVEGKITDDILRVGLYQGNKISLFGLFCVHIPNASPEKLEKLKGFIPFPEGIARAAIPFDPTKTKYDDVENNPDQEDLPGIDLDRKGE